MNTDTLVKKALEEAREFAQAHGAKSEIAAKMSEISGQAVSRQMVEKWLADERPREPQLGNGLLLIAAVQTLRNPRKPKAVTLKIEL